MIAFYILVSVAYLEIVVAMVVLGRWVNTSTLLSCCLALLWPLSLPIIIWSGASHARQLISIASIFQPGGSSSEEE